VLGRLDRWAADPTTDRSVLGRLDRWAADPTTDRPVLGRLDRWAADPHRTRSADASTGPSEPIPTPDVVPYATTPVGAVGPGSVRPGHRGSQPGGRTVDGPRRTARRHRPSHDASADRRGSAAASDGPVRRWDRGRAHRGRPLW